MPFIGFTPAQVYEFHKRIRPADDHTGPRKFTYFTFLAIDEQCVRADPMECLICCDAPDFGEDEYDINLKVLRVPFAILMKYLYALEQMAVTPSEVTSGEEFPLTSMPSPGLQVEDQTNGRVVFRCPLEEDLRSAALSMQLEQAAAELGYKVVNRDTRPNGSGAVSEEYRLATPAESRANRRTVLRVVESMESDGLDTRAMRIRFRDSEDGLKINYWDK